MKRTENNVGEGRVYLGYRLQPRETRAETQGRNLGLGMEAETIGERCLLTGSGLKAGRPSSPTLALKAWSLESPWFSQRWKPGTGSGISEGGSSRVNLVTRGKVNQAEE